MFFSSLSHGGRHTQVFMPDAHPDTVPQFSPGLETAPITALAQRQRLGVLDSLDSDLSGYTLTYGQEESGLKLLTLESTGNHCTS